MANPIRQAVGLLLLAHGSKDADWRVSFESLLHEAQARWPQRAVVLAYFEHAKPSLEEAVEGLVSKGLVVIQIEPLLLAPGFHLQRDLPDRLSQLKTRWPDLVFRTSGPLMDESLFRAAILERAERGRIQGARWLSAMGEPISCVEKLKVLEEGVREVEEAFLDLLEDAILMGCGQAGAKSEILSRLRALVSALPDHTVREVPYAD